MLNIENIFPDSTAEIELTKNVMIKVSDLKENAKLK